MKKFDLVSEDEVIIGDAKYLKNIPVPAAKFDNITAYIWFLEHTKGQRKFLIFGRDIEIPQRWLKNKRSNKGSLTNVEFYFLHDTGKLEKLHPKKEVIVNE